MKNTRFLFVVNPISGGVSKKPFYDFTESDNSFKLIDFHIVETTGKNDEEMILRKVDEIQPDCVVGIGGDGTILQLARLFMNTDMKVGVLPFGSANGMAKELGINNELNLAWSAILNDNVMDLDLIRINGEHYCLHLSDLGLNARLVKGFQEENAHGALSYVKHFFKVLPEHEKIEYNISYDQGTAKGSADSIIIANATKYGSGTVVNPVGKVNDGLFEIIVVPQINLQALREAAKTIFDESFVGDSIESYQTKKVEINLNKKQIFQIDGEYIGEMDKIEAEIVKGCVKMLV